jgi:hypothetical protein
VTVPSILDNSADRVQLKTHLSGLPHPGTYTSFSVATGYPEKLSWPRIITNFTNSIKEMKAF